MLKIVRFRRKLRVFLSFKIKKSVIYDMDVAYDHCGVSKKLKYIESEVAIHCHGNVRKYLFIIRCKEAFPAYYKVSINAVRMKLQDTQTDYVLPSEHRIIWTMNNQYFTIWINFDDTNQFMEELWLFAERKLSWKNKRLEVELDFSCANTLIEKDENDKEDDLVC